MFSCLGKSDYGPLTHSQTVHTVLQLHLSLHQTITDFSSTKLIGRGCSLQWYYLYSFPLKDSRLMLLIPFPR